MRVKPAKGSFKSSPLLRSKIHELSTAHYSDKTEINNQSKAETQKSDLMLSDKNWINISHFVCFIIIFSIMNEELAVVSCHITSLHNFHHVRCEGAKQLTRWCLWCLLFLRERSMRSLKPYFLLAIRSPSSVFIAPTLNTGILSSWMNEWMSYLWGSRRSSESIKWEFWSFFRRVWKKVNSRLP